MSDAYSDDNRVLISAIEHYSYCPRQCALIHIEQVFEENVFTLQGNAQHTRVDEEMTTFEDGKRVERALPLWSERLGLIGKADVVEFYPDGQVVPVEYKHGGRREHTHDDLQICAQALCLEEMLGVTVSSGMLFYHASHASRVVKFTAALREATCATIEAIRELWESGEMPLPVNDKRCEKCSLINICQPELLLMAQKSDVNGLFVAEEGG